MLESDSRPDMKTTAAPNRRPSLKALRPRTLPLAIFVAGAGCFSSASAAASQLPWPSDTPGFAALQAGEHPRLLFRKRDQGIQDCSAERAKPQP